jgi:hypothetical protein
MKRAIGIAGTAIGAALIIAGLVLSVEHKRDARPQVGCVTIKGWKGINGGGDGGDAMFCGGNGVAIPGQGGAGGAAGPNAPQVQCAVVNGKATCYPTASPGTVIIEYSVQGTGGPGN